MVRNLCTRPLDVLGQGHDMLYMNRTQICAVRRSSSALFASCIGLALKSQVGLEILCGFTDETLKGQLANVQLSGLLVAMALTQCNSS